MSITGGCRCGSVRYVLNIEAPPTVYACHCTDCQTWSGSAFAENFLVRSEALEVNGALVSWDYISPSGAQGVQNYCGTCHTRIFNTNSRAPGMTNVRAGTLDQSNQLSPVAHIWVASKQPWVAIPAGIPTWPKAPTPEEFAAMVAPKTR